MKSVGKWIQDDLDVLLDALPDWIRKPLEAREGLHDLLEVVLDLGRTPEGRFASLDLVLDTKEVTVDDLEFVVARLGEFGGDKYVGEFLKGKRSGLGTYTFSNGDVDHGIWEKGKLIERIQIGKKKAKKKETKAEKKKETKTTKITADAENTRLTLSIGKSF